MKTPNEDKVFASVVSSKQRSLGHSDSAMARYLGIHRSIYREIKTGDRPVSMTYFCAVIAMCPDLIPDALIFAKNRHLDCHGDEE